MADYARAHRALTDLAEALSTMEWDTPFKGNYPDADPLTLGVMYEAQLARIGRAVENHREYHPE